LEYLAQRGSWGQEVRPPLTFQRGVRFTLVIMATDRGFNVCGRFIYLEKKILIYFLEDCGEQFSFV